MRGISQTPEMVRWCARTSAYRVVGAPERRLAKTPLDRHLGRGVTSVRTAAQADAPPTSWGTGLDVEDQACPYVVDATPRALRSELIIASTPRASASASAAADAVVSGHSPG